MLIRSLKPSDATENEVTPRHLFDERRRFLRLSAGATAAALATTALVHLGARPAQAAAPSPLAGRPWAGNSKIDEELTPKEAVTGYNNFYEFGTNKEDPKAFIDDNPGRFRPQPWAIEVGGEVANAGTYDVWDLVKRDQLEERIYRHRCVETWSMVVPWVGIPLANVIRRLEPRSGARYVAFETLHDPEQMPGQRRSVLQWPYVEGLRLDEALNPLAMLVVGVYGETIPPQNGAPVRLIVPWKYGFKAIKSIVRMTFTREQPPTSWNISAPGEYGFYANVNPDVSHPRWSQAKERRIGDFLRRPTAKFNGYGEEVAHLYAGQDLAKDF